eukprot:gene965-693_t
MLEYLAGFAHDWASTFPQLHNQLCIIFRDNSEGDLRVVTKIIEEEACHILAKAVGYLRDIDIGIGFSFNLSSHKPLSAINIGYLFGQSVISAASTRIFVDSAIRCLDN